MSIKAMNWAFGEISLGIKTSAERLCLLGLAHCHNVKTGRCDPSLATLATMTGQSRRSVIRAVQDLDESGIISVVARSTRRGRVSSQYNLHIREIEALKEYIPPRGKLGKMPAWKPSKAKRNRVYTRDNSACVYCGSSNDLTLDHVVPRSKGGSDGDDNLVTACRSCNSKKGVNLPTQSEVGGTLLRCLQSDTVSPKHKSNNTETSEPSEKVDAENGQNLDGPTDFELPVLRVVGGLG